jgi:membrane-associated phospholipid phosphatase
MVPQKSILAYFVLSAIFIATMCAWTFLTSDLDAIVWMIEHEQERYGYLAVMLTRIGEPWITLTLTTLISFRHLKTAYAIVFAHICVGIVAFVCKNLIARPRPRLGLDHNGLYPQIHEVSGAEIFSGFNSMPSGHTMMAFTMATFLALRWRNSRLIAATSLILACCVGLSRIYLLNHYPTDVALGATIGLGLGVLAIQFEKKYLLIADGQ